MTREEIKSLSIIGCAVVKAASRRDTEEMELLKKQINEAYSTASLAEKEMLGIYLRVLDRTLCPN